MAKYIIVGGVAGGASTAARLRRLDESAEIILFERGEHISYASCGLPYYVGRVIEQRDHLFVQTPEKFGKRFRIDIRTKTEVMKINRSRKLVIARNLVSGEEYEESYDKLVLSPGAEPARPPIPGIDQKEIFTLRNVPDTDRIMEFLEEKNHRRVVIVGAGFIGLEMAENLHRRGIFVTIVEMAEQVMTPLDYEMAAMVHQHLKMKKVEFYLSDAVAAFGRQNNRILVELKSGRKMITDMVILSIGVRPESKLAREAGLQIGPCGGIIVDEYLQTTDPDIYAIGDAIEFPSPIIGKRMCIYLAGPATKQGRMTAENIVMGNKRKYHGSLATAIARVFDITVASTGISEKVLWEENLPYEAFIIHAPSHAGYYPDAKPMSIKILFSRKDGRIYGAQIVGYSGVDKRIDILSTLIRYGGTVDDLAEMEHAYAPPYSSSKDPINTLGFVAENIMAGLTRIAHWYDVDGLLEEGVCLLDVRSKEEFDDGSIKGAVNIPIDEIRDRMEEIPQDCPILIFCWVGLRGYLAERILRQHGFENLRNLSGGYKTYQLATLKQSNEDIFEKDYIGVDDSIYHII